MGPTGSLGVPKASWLEYVWLKAWAVKAHTVAVATARYGREKLKQKVSRSESENWSNFLLLIRIKTPTRIMKRTTFQQQKLFPTSATIFPNVGHHFFPTSDTIFGTKRISQRTARFPNDGRIFPNLAGIFPNGIPPGRARGEEKPFFLIWASTVFLIWGPKFPNLGNVLDDWLEKRTTF